MRKLKPDARSLDPLLRRPARRGQDVARPVDRRGDGPRVRAHLGRRRARRVGDPRPPAHLHRRDARARSSARCATPGSNNPVLMIDEIDKMGADFRGDPSSAMLEVLDPEQNSTFRDHYLDLPFDLSQVIFITTANQLEPIPRAAARPHGGDRARRLHRGGEARDRQALPRAAPDRAQRAGASRRSSSPTRRCARSSRATRARPACATSSARSARSAARSRASSPRAARRSKRTIRPKHGARAARPAPLPARRGAAHGRARRGHRPGVDAGGRRRAVRRGHRLPRRGQAADHRPARRRDEGVGRRRRSRTSSATRSSWATTCPRTGSASTTSTCTCPAGAIPKDGPSAGITMATALASLVTGRPVRADTAMTGEITLTGQVLPIGGLKEKALAAQRAGITRVIAPKLNEPDLDEFPAHLSKDIEFVFVDTVDEVLGAPALASPQQRRRARTGRREAWPLAGLSCPRPGMRPSKRIRGEQWHRRRKAAKAGAGAVAAGKAARDNPYVQRLIEDEELRDNLRTAFESARKAYERMSTARARPRPDGRQEGPEGAARRRPRRCATRPTRCADAASARSAARGGCCSSSSARAWRSPSARACARRSSTRCSGPRRSSSTPRPPPRPRRRDARASRSARPSRPSLAKLARGAPRGASSRRRPRAAPGWPAS